MAINCTSTFISGGFRNFISGAENAESFLGLEMHEMLGDLWKLKLAEEYLGRNAVFLITTVF